LTLNGGKEAAVRLIVTAAAVALGVGLLLIALSGMNAINAQNARSAWLNTPMFSHGPGPILPGASLPASSGKGSTTASRTHSGAAPSPPSVAHPSIGSANTAGNGNAATTDPLWGLFTTDHFGTQTIDRVDVAGTGPNSPIPPGISRLPGPGQFYASPALTRLLRTTPAAELGDRFPGKQIGIIGPSALPSPNSQIIVIGDRVQQISETPGAAEITAINTTTGHSGGSNGWDANKLQIILAVGALALLFPVLIFIGTATRLAAARRDQRFSAMRLVGATPRQVSVIAAVEASIAALAGVAAGFAVFFALRPTLTSVPFTGAPFAPGDLSLSMKDVLLVAIGVPIAAAATARLALRRVRISPLGVSRRVTPPAPRAYRLVPLVAGIAELAYFVDIGRPKSTGGQIDAYFSGCLLIMLGLVMAGPWLTMVGSRVMARRTSRPAVLIAARRLSDNPRAAFRAISGLILALFVTSVSVGVISTILDYRGSSSGGGGGGANATLVDQLAPGDQSGPPPTLGGASVQSGTSPGSVSGRLLTELHAIRDVQGVTVVHATPNESQNAQSGAPTVIASCAQLARTPALGRCASGAAVVTVTANLVTGNATSKSTLATSVWPAAAISPQQLEKLPVEAIVVETTKSSALEQARTALETAFPNQNPPVTLGEIDANSTRSITELQQMTNVVMLVSLVIAGCSLAVSAAAGISERKRPFSLLRLTGVPTRVLRRVVTLETAVPLLVISVVSAGMGFLAADLFLRSQLSESLQPPGIDYYVIVAAGLVASLAIIASTLPLVERITGPEIARNE
jgi:hypothetical protein